MHILFIHQNYPAQFGHIARYLVVKFGSIWDLPHSRCSGVVVRHIASPREPVSKNVPGASLCFRSSCWALPKGAASSAPVSMSSSSPSIWQSPLPRRPAPFAAPTPVACAAVTPAGSRTCPASAGACGSASLSAASSAPGPTAPDASSPSDSRGSPRRGPGPLTGSARPRRTSARRWVARPAHASLHAWGWPPAPTHMEGFGRG